MAGTETTVETFRCTVKGCGRTFPTPQGLGAHRYQKHGIKADGSKRTKPSSFPPAPKPVADDILYTKVKPDRWNGPTMEVPPRVEAAPSDNGRVREFPVVQRTILFEARGIAAALSGLGDEIERSGLMMDSDLSSNGKTRFEFETGGYSFKLTIKSTI